MHLSENSSGYSLEGNLFLEIFTYLMAKVRITVSYYEAGCYKYTIDAWAHRRVRCGPSIDSCNNICIQRRSRQCFALRTQICSKNCYYTLKIKTVEKIIKTLKTCCLNQFQNWVRILGICYINLYYYYYYLIKGHSHWIRVMETFSSFSYLYLVV